MCHFVGRMQQNCEFVSTWQLAKDRLVARVTLVSVTGVFRATSQSGPGTPPLHSAAQLGMQGSWGPTVEEEKQ